MASTALDFDLKEGGRYGIGASWIPPAAGRPDVDIDLQCVVINSAGTIIDCAYYNNLKAVRSITHSGDELAANASSKDSHLQEVIWVNFNKLPETVGLLLFVVAAYSGGQLKDVGDGMLRLFKDDASNELLAFQMERSGASVAIVAAMFRDWRLSGSSQWKFRRFALPAERGQHFMDILPSICRLTRSFIPHAPEKQQVAFAMEKGAVLDLPQGLSKITVGLGWDVDDGNCDLDVSAVLMNSAGAFVEVVFFGRLECKEHGILHTGDNLTGEGEGDDEQIIVELKGVGSQVTQIFFVVNIYEKGKTFAQVANPYCRVVDDSTRAELCRYELRDAGSESGLIIARIVREVGDRWGFHALGLPCRGNMYKDSLPQILELAGFNTASLRHAGSGQVAHATVVAATKISEAPKSSACLIL